MVYFWATLEKNIPFLLNFVFTIVVARLVTPDAYGLVAMTAILTALATVVQNMGFTSALVQRKTISSDDTMTVFIVNIGLSVVLAAILLAASPYIATFFGRDEIVLVVQINSACLLMAAFAGVQMVILQREFKFRTGLIVDGIATLAAGSTAIFLAIRGSDLVALLAMMFVRQFLQTLLLWALVRWWPSGRFSVESFRSLWKFARHMIGASLYHQAANNLVSVLLGRFTSAATLGLFSRAQSLQALPVALISQPVQRVAFPLLSKHQEDTLELKRIIGNQSKPIAVLAAFTTAFLAACATEIVLILVGPAWTDSIPILEVLAFAAFFNIQFHIHSEANKAIGESGWFFRIEMLKKTLLVIAVVIGVNLGIIGLAWALVVASVLDYLLSAASTVKFIGLSWKEQFVSIAPSAIVGAVAIFAALSLETILPAGSLFFALIGKGTVISLTFLIAIGVGREKIAGEAYSVAAKLGSSFAKRTRRSL